MEQTLQSPGEKRRLTPNRPKRTFQRPENVQCLDCGGCHMTI